MVRQVSKSKALFFKIIRGHKMKKIFLFFMLSLIGSFHAYADENELLIHAVEYERIIINWNPRGQQLARVLAYACTDCEIKTFSINTDTELEDENGRLLDIHQLAEKIDWQGTIQTTNRDPNLIIKIMLH